MNSKSGDKKLPDDLQDTARSLRDQRPALEPLELDQIKLRAMSGARRKKGSGFGAGTRSRATAFLTVAFLTVGTGGALALHGGKGVESGSNHSASYHVYKCRGKLSGYKCIPVPPPTCKKIVTAYSAGVAVGGYGQCPPKGNKGGKGGKGGGKNYKGYKGGKGKK